MRELDRSDLVRLRGCTVEGATLACGVEVLELNALGRIVARRLIEAETPFGMLLDELTDRFAVERQIVRRDLGRFLAAADCLGIVEVRSYRPPTLSWRILDLVAELLALQWLDRPQIRHAPSLAGAVAGITLAYRLPLALLAFTAVGMYAAMANVSGAVGGLPLILGVAGLGAGGLATLAAHEVGHMVVAGRVGGVPLAFISGPLRLHLRRRPAPSRRADRLIALAGPLSGAIVGSMLGLGARQLDLPPGFDWILLVWSIAHLGCLLPVFDDGKQVFVR